MNTRIRFIAKASTKNGRTVWGVYDKTTASYPHQREGIGTIAQEHATERAAQAEVDRVTAWHDQQERAR